MAVLKLTTAAACEVVGLHRDRFNEHVAAGNFGCAPPTVAGKARVFDPTEMLGLFYFKRLMDDGLPAAIAGSIACQLMVCAQEYPDEKVLAHVETYMVGSFMPFHQAPLPDTWDTHRTSGSDVRKVTFYNVEKARQLIAHYTEEYASTIGPRDE